MSEVRSASVAAPGRLRNEDAAFHVGGLVGVLDGVTQAEGVESGCVHGAAWYVQRLSARLVEHYSAQPNRSLADLLTDSIAAVRGDHPDCDLTRPATPAATVCLVCVGDERVDYLVLCDATLVIESEGGDILTVTDDRFQQVLARLHQRTTALHTVDDALSVNRGYTPGKWEYINREGGYWIAAADPSAAAHAITGTLAREGEASPSRIALLSDGAACAVDSLGILTWAGLFKVLSEDGPSELIRQVRDAERTRQSAGHITGKPHDDATAAVLLITEEP
ncbi:MAG: hypothetical protein HOV79_13360 [Hamadaea sp.]|nr:hypothetical protein [Hamadaea sp.]